jgi:hypothetical protein
VVQNALQQTERVCAMMKQLADSHPGSAVAPSRKGAWKTRAGQADDAVRAPDVMLSSGAGQKPLTRREREVLNLISEGHSIAPRRCGSSGHETPRTLSVRRCCIRLSRTFSAKHALGLDPGGGPRFASRKRVQSRIWSPFRFYRNGKGSRSCGLMWDARRCLSATLLLSRSLPRRREHEASAALRRL